MCIVMYNMLYNILNSIARFQLEFLCLAHYLHALIEKCPLC